MRWRRCSWTEATLGLFAAVALATTACAIGGSAMAGEETGNGIEDVEWRLVRLDTGPVQAEPGPRAPSLKLESATRRAFGSGGCNRFTTSCAYGSYGASSGANTAITISSSTNAPAIAVTGRRRTTPHTRPAAPGTAAGDVSEPTVVVMRAPSG